MDVIGIHDQLVDSSDEDKAPKNSCSGIIKDDIVDVDAPLDIVERNPPPSHTPPEECCRERNDASVQESDRDSTIARNTGWTFVIE